MTTGWSVRRPREVSLRRLISRQCKCSRRCVYLLDEHFDFPTDAEMDEFIAAVRPTEFNWAHEIHDCDDLAFEFLVKARCWFRAQKKNVAVASIAIRATAFRKPHAFNFFIRKSDHRLIFIDGFERVPLVGRAYLVVM